MSTRILHAVLHAPYTPKSIRVRMQRKRHVQQRCMASVKLIETVSNCLPRAVLHAHYTPERMLARTQRRRQVQQRYMARVKLIETVSNCLPHAVLHAHYTPERMLARTQRRRLVEQRCMARVKLNIITAFRGSVSVQLPQAQSTVRILRYAHCKPERTLDNVVGEEELTSQLLYRGLR